MPSQNEYSMNGITIYLFVKTARTISLKIYQNKNAPYGAFLTELIF